MVTHAPLRKESNHNNKDGLPPSGRPGAGWTCQLFKGSNSCWETDPFSWLCSANTSSQSCQRRPWAREGLDLGGKGAASLGLAHRSAHPSRAQADCFFLFFFFNFPHPVCPNPPEPGAEPARRGGRGPHPAKRRLTCASGRRSRQAGKGRRGRGCQTGYAGARGSQRGWASGETRREMAAAESVRRRLPGRHALDPGASYSPGAGREPPPGELGGWRRARAPGPARLSSASGERARRRRSRSAPGRGAPGPYANRKRPRPSRAAAWAGSGRVGGARPRALGLHSGVFSSAESLGALAVTVGGWC